MAALWCASCGEAMKFIYCVDSGSGITVENYSLAYNLYVCERCFALCREQLWDFKGKVWLCADDTMFKE